MAKDLRAEWQVSGGGAASVTDSREETTQAAKASRSVSWRTLIPGLVVAVVVAIAATELGHLVPVIGGPVFGIVIGIILAPILRGSDPLIRQGRSFASKRVLQISIVVLGTGLSLRQIVRAGIHSLPVMLGTLCLALLATWIVGRLLHVENPLRTLIGVGTGICGASAIAATSAVLSAAELDVAYAVSTIFMFNVIAVLLFPALGHLFGLSQHAFGLWAGTAVNDTSSVVAAAYTYGHAAGSYAVVVKLTRTLMIIPITIGLASWYSRQRSQHRNHEAQQESSSRLAGHAWYRAFPMFIAYFVLASTLKTLGAIPDSWQPALSSTAIFLITVALTAIGLSTSFADMRRTGLRPLLLGAVLWVTVAISSIALQAVTGQL